MLQIAIWLGAFLIALKGVELRFAAVGSARPPAERDRLISAATAIMVVCFVVAGAFVWLANRQSEGVGNLFHAEAPSSADASADSLTTTTDVPPPATARRRH